MTPAEPASNQTQRLDQWLWFARFFKTRTLASSLVSKGRVRVNGTKVKKPSQKVMPGDILTFVTPTGVQVVKIIKCASRRGPAPEAARLYEHLPD